MKKPKEIIGPFFFKRHGTAEIVTKLPELHRSVKFDRAQIDEAERIVPCIFATETPVERWFGQERLICSSEACDTSRTNTNGAFLSGHDDSKQIGVIVPQSVTFGADRVGRAKLRFSKNNPLAEQEWKDVLDGIRGLFSVGYQVNRLLLREESDQGDIYDAVEWEILEISLVSIPADADCILDESRNNSFTFPVRIVTSSQQPIEKQQAMLKRSKYFARFAQFNTPPKKEDGNPDGGEPGGGGGEGGRKAGETPTRGKEPTAAEVRMAETTRVRELGALGARFNCMEKMTEFMNDGSTVEKAYRYIIDEGLNDGKRKTGVAGGNNKPLLTQGDAPQMQLSRSIGTLFVENPVFKALKRGTPNQRAGVVIDDYSAFRATVTTAGLGPAGLILPDRLPGVQLLLQQRLTVSDLLASGATGSNKIEYIRETLYANAAAMVDEGDPKPEASFTMDIVDAPVRKVAVTAKISDEMLEDWPYVQSYVDTRLTFMVQEREELQLLRGDGNAPNILGLMVTPDILTQAMGDDSAVDAIYKGITKIRVIGRVEPDGVVIHPNDWETIRLTKDANGQYLAGGPFYAPYGQGQFASIERIWGLPVVVTTNTTEGTALVGAFRTQAQVFRRKGITLDTTNSNEDDFKNNLVAIRAEERLALCVYRPAGFCEVTGLNA